MAREALVAALLWSAGAFGQSQRPLPKGSPEEFTAPAVRVSVVVHEDLHPDRLRRLARRDVTLWLQTRTNTLRTSTMENVGRFDEAFVQLRAPLTPTDSQMLTKLPRAGVWVEVSALSILTRLPGPRRVAIDVSGPIDSALADRLTAAKPAIIRWAPGPNIDLLEWGLFRNLPGRKVVVLSATATKAVRCEERTGPSIEVDVATVLTLNSDVFPCGNSARVIIRPTIDHWMLQSLVVRDPSVELVVVIGRDEEAAAATRSVLDLLDRRDSR